jgi:large subunit ribosomal protein L15
MNLKDLHAIRVPRTARRRLGRGWGSGIGKTSGRGEKGAGRRSGTRFRLRFEGGQMPLYRRLPKKGFSNHAFRTRFHAVNVGDLERAFDAGAVVDLDALRAAHLAPKSARLWKLLGDGTLSKALTVKAHAASGQAKDKVGKSGGTLELVPGAHLERQEELAVRREKQAKRREASIATARADAEKAVATFRAARADAAAKAKGGKAAKPAKGAGGGAPKGEKPAAEGAGGEKPKGERPAKPEKGGKPGKGAGGEGGGAAPKA